MASNQSSQQSSDHKEKESPGNSAMPLWAILTLIGYLILVASFSIYVLVKIWPHRTPAGVANVTDSAPAQSSAAQSSPPPNGPAASGSPSPTASPAQSSPSPTSNKEINDRLARIEQIAQGDGAPANPLWVKFFWNSLDNEKWILGTGHWIWAEVRLVLIVLLSGVLGSLLHSIRSFYEYAGNRRLVTSWAVMYFMLPFYGALMALVVYLVFRGGLFSPSASVDETSPFGFAAIAALMGMFSHQAAEKLKEVAETLLSKPPHGKDHVSPSPALTSIDPKEGSEKGGQKVTIAGTGFLAGAKVVIGDTEAQSVTIEGEKKITATTPPHKPGPVDVVITNSDGKSGKLANGYTYLADGAPTNGGENGSEDESGNSTDTSTPVTTPATNADSQDTPQG